MAGFRVLVQRYKTIFVIFLNTKKESLKANDGESLTEGCLKRTCKNGVWRTSLSQDSCCFNGKVFSPGSTITTTTFSVVRCVVKDGMVKTVVEDKPSCNKYATAEQVLQMLENYFVGKSEISTPYISFVFRSPIMCGPQEHCS